MHAWICELGQLRSVKMQYEGHNGVGHGNGIMTMMTPRKEDPDS